MKTAEQILDEMVRAVRPPRGIAVALEESSGGLNWDATTGAMDLNKTQTFSEKVAALRKSDPIVDWSAVTEKDGNRRRVAKWSSEVPD